MRRPLARYSTVIGKLIKLMYPEVLDLRIEASILVQAPDWEVTTWDAPDFGTDYETKDWKEYWVTGDRMLVVETALQYLVL